MHTRTTTPAAGTIRFSMQDLHSPEYLAHAAEQVRQLPGVLDVRPGTAPNQMEIQFAQPADGLLRAIHLTLKQLAFDRQTA